MSHPSIELQALTPRCHGYQAGKLQRASEEKFDEAAYKLHSDGIHRKTKQIMRKMWHLKNR